MRDPPVVLLMDALRAYFTQLREGMRIVDLVDVGVIAVLIYLGLVWLRSRASRAALLALVLVALLYVASRFLGMYLTSLLFQAGITVILLGLVLIFHEDLRDAFERIASMGKVTAEPPAGPVETIDLLVVAISRLAEKKTGALIVLQGRETLDRHVRGGIPLAGTVSAPLIQSLFDVHSPGHDGAVLIEGGRIERFAVHLPLSRNLEEVGERGTRHAAALGLAERSDALVVAVSEERGTICIADGPKLQEIASPLLLKQRLESFYRGLFREPATQPSWRAWLTRHLPLKLSALVLAGLLWLAVFPVESVQRTYRVPVEYRNLPTNWAVAEPDPAEATPTLVGPEHAFQQLVPERLRVALDLSNVRPGWQRIYMTNEMLNLPAGVSVTRLEPPAIELEAWPLRRAVLPVRPRLVGRLPEPLRLDRIELVPDRVEILLPDNGQPEPVVLTETIDLRGIRQTTTVRLNLVLPPHARLSEPAPRTADVTVVVSRRGEDEGREAAVPETE